MQVTRRTFAASLASAFAAPVELIRSVEPSREINWELFVDRGKRIVKRFDLSSPFVACEKTIATNGCVLVSVPGAGVTKPCSGGLVPELNKLAWGEFEAGGWRSSSAIQMGGDEAVLLGHTFDLDLMRKVATLGDFDWRIVPFVYPVDNHSDGGIMLFRFGRGGKGFLAESW